MRLCVAVAVFFLPLTAEPYAIDLAYQRAVDMALASSILPSDVVENARDACGTALCFARALAADLPDQVRLEPIIHPDTDSIRRARTAPSVFVDETADGLKLKLTHFGRKSVSEFRKALADADRRLHVDISGNPGGDFERMLSIAGLLLGPVQDAIEIDHGDHVERRSLKGPARRSWRVRSVETDDSTASAALLLARMLAAHGGAALSGRPLDEKKIFLKRRMSIHHDWRLVLPVAEVRIVEP